MGGMTKGNAMLSTGQCLDMAESMLKEAIEIVESGLPQDEIKRIYDKKIASCKRWVNNAQTDMQDTTIGGKTYITPEYTKNICNERIAAINATLVTL
jgi:chaperonin GroEL (HSP60 family)